MQGQRGRAQRAAQARHLPSKGRYPDACFDGLLVRGAMKFSCKPIPIRSQRPFSGDSHGCNRVARSAEVKGSRRMGLILLPVTALIHAHHGTKCHFHSVKRRRV
jgi:hypothetical protein